MSDSAFRSLLNHVLLPALTVTILAFTAGCTSGAEEGPTGPDAPTEPLEYETVERSHVELETIDQGAYGDTEEDTLRVIRDQVAFESFWESLHGDGADAPDVDFSGTMVLAAVLGERPTGGYEAEIRSITRDVNPTVVGVFVTEIEPGPNCNVTQAITVPYHIVKMDQISTDRIQFQDNGTETKECSDPGSDS